MKSIFFFALLAIIIHISSCGISEKGKVAFLQAQQAKDDSIRVAQVKQVKDEDALQSALGDSLAARNALLNNQQQALVQLRTTIYTANDEMTQIKAFHFGRLPQAREEQVRNQELKIQSLFLQETNLQTAVQHTWTVINREKAELGSIKWSKTRAMRIKRRLSVSSTCRSRKWGFLTR